MEEDDDDWYRKNEDGLYGIEVTTNRFSDVEFQRIIRTVRENTRHTDAISVSCNGYTIERVKSLVEALEHSRSVTSFSIFESQIDECVAAELSKALEYPACKITILELFRNQIDDNATKLLVQALKTNKTVTKLNLLGNTHKFKLLAPAIKHIKTLRVLRVHSERLKSDGCKALADALKNHQTIEVLHVLKNKLSSKNACQLLEALLTVKSLKTFDLEDEEMNNGVCKLVAALLQNGLTALALTSSGISLNDARVLKKALRNNTTLKSLKLAIWNDHLPVLKVTQALKVNTSLEVLDLSGDPVYVRGPQWLPALCATLETNTTLKSLNLASTNIKTAVHPLVDLIRGSCSLTSLDLRSNRLDYAIGTIAAALTDNTSLKQLMLGHNGDYGIGSLALAYALKNNTTLRVLDLEGCFFETDVFSALKVNKTLTKLNIQHILCGASVFELMKSLLDVNTTLYNVNFAENGCTWDEAQQINALLARNKRQKLVIVELFRAVQVILLPKDRGLFNSMPLELVEQMFSHFVRHDHVVSPYQLGDIVALAMDREFLSAELSSRARSDKLWDLVRKAKLNV